MSSSQSPDPGRRVVDEDLGDLFEEAPVAYVHEDMDTRFIRANRAAREILGISAEEVSRTSGISMCYSSTQFILQVFIYRDDPIHSIVHPLRRGVQLLIFCIINIYEILNLEYLNV